MTEFGGYNDEVSKRLWQSHEPATPKCALELQLDKTTIAALCRHWREDRPSNCHSFISGMAMAWPIKECGWAVFDELHWLAKVQYERVMDSFKTPRNIPNISPSCAESEGPY